MKVQERFSSAIGFRRVPHRGLDPLLQVQERFSSAIASRIPQVPQPSQ